MQYKLNLKAGEPFRQEFTGTTLVLLSLVGASAVNMDVEIQGFSVESLRGIKAGARLRSNGFTSATFTSATNCVAEVVATSADLSINMIEGAAINANILGTVPVSAPAPLAVVPDRGAPGAPVYVSGITYSDAPATGITDRAAVPVTSAGAALLALLATRKGARFCNLGPDPVTIGTTGHTWAKRCIVLEAGDVWIEERAANIAWTAITDATKTASVTVQEVIA